MNTKTEELIKRIKEYDQYRVDGDLPLKYWLELADAGVFENSSTEIQCLAGWYDWFCPSYELCDRLYEMLPMIFEIASRPKIAKNLDNIYVFFKNNCPCDGPLYDDFRFCDINTKDVLFTIAMRPAESEQYSDPYYEDDEDYEEDEPSSLGAPIEEYEVWDFSEDNVPNPMPKYNGWENAHIFDNLFEVYDYFGPSPESKD